MHKVIRATLAAVVVVVATAGCGRTTPHDDIATPMVSPLPTIVATVLAGRGEIVSQQSVDPPFDDPDHVLGATRRAVYRTVSGVDGGQREVSGLFVLPQRTPPPGGWPVVAVAHGTTGIATDCGPSSDPKLLGYLPTVRDLAANGYAVAFTDYQGLGTPGTHPYLEPRTSAFDLTDAARAIRNIFPNVSNRWVAFGNSQGGQASWAADEFARNYGDHLDLVGAVALSPAANMTPFAQRSAGHTLTDDQQSMTAILVAGMERYDPALKARHLIDDAVHAHENDVFACHPTAASNAVPYPHLNLSNPDDVAALRDALRRIALPQQQLNAPLLVINGLADETIPAPWTTAAVAAACKLGGQIQHIEAGGAGHGDLGAKAYARMYQWMHDRVASLPVPSNCGQAPEQLGHV